MADQNSNQFVDIENAREDEQIEVMEQIAKQDHCPFCQENLAKYHRQPILKQTKYWLLTTNQWPYPDTKTHLLIIYKDHATQLTDLADEAGSELFSLVKWAQTEYQSPGGGWSMRFGDTNYSAGTVAHIHVQFIVPDISKASFKPVKIKLGKDKKS